MLSSSWASVLPGLMSRHSCTDSTILGCFPEQLLCVLAQSEPRARETWNNVSNLWTSAREHCETALQRPPCEGAAFTPRPRPLTTVSLFLKCKAADVSSGSGRGEWNVEAISSHTHTHQIQLPKIDVNSCWCQRLHLVQRAAWSTSQGLLLSAVRGGWDSAAVVPVCLGSTPSARHHL